MDVDGGNTGQGPQSGNDIDIDTSFLQQFSCLGTTDHEELISQLQKVMGNQLNHTTARFFLDMNNWNVQAAVGSYFDFNCGSVKIPSMTVLTCSVNEAVQTSPNTTFMQSWRVKNTGDEPWPAGCLIRCTSYPDEPQVTLDGVALQPNEEKIISVPQTSPAHIGPFHSKWRLCTPNGTYFGDDLWIVVTVSETGTLCLQHQMEALSVSNLDEVTVACHQAPGSLMAGPLAIYHGLQLVGPLNIENSTGNGTTVSHQTQTMDATQQPLPDDSEMW